MTQVVACICPLQIRYRPLNQAKSTSRITSRGMRSLCTRSLPSGAAKSRE